MELLVALLLTTLCSIGAFRTNSRWARSTLSGCYRQPICRQSNSFRLSSAIEADRESSISSKELNSHGLTTAGGRKHTVESRAKISKANKGKVPWNYGKAHSPETKARIAEKTKEAMAKRKQKKLDALGLTLEQYNDKQVVDRKKLRKEKGKGGLTPEGRKRISESVKARWKDPGYREKYALQNRGNRNHTLETRARISDAIKAKWREPEYREKIHSSAPSAEVRARISSTLKQKWTDPEFRKKMLTHSFERTNEWRNLVSEKIKQKWTDPEYRSNVENGMRVSNRTMIASNYKFTTRSAATKTGKESVQKIKLQKQIQRLAAKQRKIHRKSVENEVKPPVVSTLEARINESKAMIDNTSNDTLEKGFAGEYSSDT